MKRFKVLREQMPGVQFVLWCSRVDVGAIICEWLAAENIPYQTLPTDAPVTKRNQSECLVIYEPFSDINVWIRDAFWPSILENGQSKLLDTVDEEASDQGWAKRLAQSSIGLELQMEFLGATDEQKNNLGIAGGNVLADQDWLMFGKPAPVLETVYKTLVKPNAKVMIVTEHHGEELLYHLDLFLTPTGQEADGRYIILLGKCVALFPELQVKADEINQRLDALVIRLENQYGFKVIRNPMPLGKYLFSYNNCITEVAGDKKNVWLPAYTFDFPDINILRDCEAENRQIWQQLGFNPRMIEASFEDVYGVRAGLHCITNEVRSF